jgi:hypothetical protein
MLIKHCLNGLSCREMLVRAEKLAKQLGHENFACNNGWLDRFKNRRNIVCAKVSAELQ